jgi:hypothetical protein
MPIAEWKTMLDTVDSINLEVHSEHTPISHFMLCLYAAKKEKCKRKYNSEYVAEPMARIRRYYY